MKQNKQFFRRLLAVAFWLASFIYIFSQFIKI